MSEVPFTRSLPYVLRQKLGAAVHGGHTEGISAGVSVLIGKVVSVPGPDRVTVAIQGANVTIPKLSTYSPIVNEPAFILSDPAFTLAHRGGRQ